MTRAEPFFRGLTVGTVVHRAVVVLREEMCVARAAQLLLKRRLRAAPVADSSGRCVGVLSVVDILRWDLQEQRPGPNHIEATSCVWCDWQIVDVESTGRDDVIHCMMRDPVLVTLDTGLLEIARILIDSHPRPVVVVDADRRPVGMLSSKDVLAALASVERGPEEESDHWSAGGHEFADSTVGSNIVEDSAEFAHAR